MIMKSIHSRVNKNATFCAVKKLTFHVDFDIFDRAGNVGNSEEGRLTNRSCRQILSAHNNSIWVSLNLFKWTDFQAISILDGRHDLVFYFLIRNLPWLQMETRRRVLC